MHTPNDDAKKVLLEIAKCSNFYSDACPSCQKIRHSASNTEKYLPIPWQGHIETALILFISSNPSVLGNVARREIAYGPTKHWSNDEEIVDFFESRFDTHPSTSGQYSHKGIYYRCNQQSPNPFSKHWVRYWASIRKRAAELLNKPHNEIKPGIDYALTEIVHCQSNNEEGVAEAKSVCMERYFNSVIGLAKAARIIVILGSQALHLLNEKENINLEEYHWKQVPLGGLDRIVLALPHPNSRGKRKALTKDELNNFPRTVKTK